MGGRGAAIDWASHLDALLTGELYLADRRYTSGSKRRKELVMQPNRIPLTAMVIAALAGALTGPAGAQEELDTLPRLVERNLGGPRFGLTYVGIKDELRPYLRDGEFHRIVSQFGWHFESQITTEGGGPQFVIQFVAMVAGVEHGEFLPNATLAMGVRLPSGFEAGVGPNLQLTEPVSSALVIAVGKSLNYGGVSIPLNLVYAINPNGNRFSVIVGYAIQRSRSRRVGKR
jgi:hypothetical protein